MIKIPKEIERIFSGWRILAAISIGLSVSIILMSKEFDVSNYKHLEFTTTSLFYLLLAIFFEALRDIAYIYRIYLMTDKEISWRSGFKVIMLWEFASALTPTIVGGTAVSLFIVNKELKNFGKSTAIVLTTALLDEIFYIVMAPLLILIVGVDYLFIDANFKFLGNSQVPIETLFLIGYIIILLFTLSIFISIFFTPYVFKNLLTRLFSIKLLRRWKEKSIHIGDEIIITSKMMKGKSFIFWLKVFMATMVSWTARYAVINMLILVMIGKADHLIIFARQLLMWVILLVSPTPGGSGIAEYMLPKFLGDYMEPFSNEIALSWRLLSYYSYLIIGIIVLPIWLRSHVKSKK